MNDGLCGLNRVYILDPQQQGAHRLIPSASRARNWAEFCAKRRRRPCTVRFYEMTGDCFDPSSSPIDSDEPLLL